VEPVPNDHSDGGGRDKFDKSPAAGTVKLVCRCRTNGLEGGVQRNAGGGDMLGKARSRPSAETISPTGGSFLGLVNSRVGEMNFHPTSLSRLEEMKNSIDFSIQKTQNARLGVFN